MERQKHPKSRNAWKRASTALLLGTLALGGCSVSDREGDEKLHDRYDDDRDDRHDDDRYETDHDDRDRDDHHESDDRQDLNEPYDDRDDGSDDPDAMPGLNRDVSGGPLLDAWIKAAKSGDASASAKAWEDLIAQSAKTYGNAFEFEASAEAADAQRPADEIGEASWTVHLVQEGSVVYALSLPEAEFENRPDKPDQITLYRQKDDRIEQIAGEEANGSESLTVTAPIEEIEMDGSLELALVREAFFSGGFARSVDPIRHPEAYTFTLDGQGNTYVVTIASKSGQLDMLAKSSQRSADGKPVIAFDSTSMEMWSICFDENGVLMDARGELLGVGIPLNDSQTLLSLHLQAGFDRQEEASALASQIENVFQTRPAAGERISFDD